MAGRETFTDLTLGALKRAAVIADHAFPPPQGLVVLIYHRVGRLTRSRVDLPEWLFDEQVARIAAGPGAVPLGTAVTQLVAEDPKPIPGVVVTFDDGTADFVDVALPVLVRHKVPATLYVATEYVESGRPFPQEGKPVSWAGLSEAMSTGLVTIGSHTHSHALFDRITPEAAAQDLDRSIGLIRDRLGVDAHHFAYPKALPGPAPVEAEVRSRFRSAALAGTRPNPYGRSDPHRLARSPVQVEDGLRYFDRKVSGGMRLEDRVRTIANRRRFAGLQS